jgi:alpha-tubulin suppressor-like RCC1 family protein
VPVVALALASDHTCALADDGTVRCWGAGGTGALGYANTSSLTAPITAGVDVGGGVTSLSANGAFGTGFTCAVVSSTAPLAECWGSAIGGRLGYGNADNVGDDETPAFVGDVSLGDPPVAIAAGAGHTCAILTTGDVRCWGEGADGRLGTAATSTIGDDEVPSSIPVVDVGGAVDELALGGAHTCARLGTAVRCWGMGAFGQLGYAATASIGDDEAPSTAGDVPVGLPVRQITAGLLHTCAVVGAGTVRCWGSGGRGQLGHGNAATIGDDETPASAGDVPLF